MEGVAVVVVADAVVAVVGVVVVVAVVAVGAVTAVAKVAAVLLLLLLVLVAGVAVAAGVAAVVAGAAVGVVVVATGVAPVSPLIGHPACLIALTHSVLCSAQTKNHIRAQQKKTVTEISSSRACHVAHVTCQMSHLLFCIILWFEVVCLLRRLQRKWAHLLALFQQLSVG